MSSTEPHIVIIGAGIGGLTTAALLAKQGHRVTVLEAQTYPGGCAGTFTHGGYRFDAGATVAGGFQPNGPHHLVGERLGIKWPVQAYEPAWITHLPDRSVALTKDNEDVLRAFPESAGFWEHQRKLADLGWTLSAQGLPWPPTSLADVLQLARVGLTNFPEDLLLLPLAFRTTYQWVRQHGLAQDSFFVRFIDAQLLISSQT
ncbi:MAG: FAD-dependent oxidoreductase, partial [Anaerolineae bacterium]|nr:FAD-dependent oxidoreductase [Anaerolineae bacterium]